LISALIAIFWPVYEGSWNALGGHVFLYKMFDEQIIGSYGYQLWFMSTLFQFYLVFYILVNLENYLSKRLFLFLSVIISLMWALIVWCLGKEDQRIWNSFFLQYIWEFVLGMVLAGWLKEGKLKQNFRAVHFLLPGIIFCGLYAWMGMKGGAAGHLFNDYFALLGYSSIAIFLYKILPHSWVKGMVWIGTFSFALYLWHMLILEIVKYLSGDAIAIYHLAIILIISVAVSYWYNKWFTLFIEKYNV
jgi:peptidoglycan/LPS O-acetylase OafA/YrhL